MAIYELKEEERALEENGKKSGVESLRDRMVSSIGARLFFLFLLLADLLWVVYAFALFFLSFSATLLTFFEVSLFKRWMQSAWKSIKRSLVCGISLVIALFSPALGIMIACTYFLMYDKAGIEEVVPSALQAQFEEFFNSK